MRFYENFEYIDTFIKNGELSQIRLIKNKVNNTKIILKRFYNRNELFYREVDVLEKLKTNDNIVKMVSDLIDVKRKSTTQKIGIVNLEYIEGHTLSEIDLNKISFKNKVFIVEQLISTLKFIHSNCIIYRNFEPKHIILKKDHSIKLIDFTKCKLNYKNENDSFIFKNLSTYTAPELIDNFKSATIQSDLYSLGAIIYFLFTSQNPPIAKLFSETIENSNVLDERFKICLKKLVCINPSQRYNSVIEVEEVLIPLLINLSKESNKITLYYKYEVLDRLRRYLYKNNDYSLEYIKKILIEDFKHTYALKKDKFFFFLGENYYFKCKYNAEKNFFNILNIEKITLVDSEILKRSYKKINVALNLIDRKNVSFDEKMNIEIKNEIIDYSLKFNEKRFIDLKYKEIHGTWKETLIDYRNFIKEQTKKYQYTKHSFKDGIHTFVLKKSVFIDEEFDSDIKFIYKKVDNRKIKANQSNITHVGNYYRHYKNKSNYILETSGKDSVSIPEKGELYIDNSIIIFALNKQIEALDLLEKNNSNFSFNFKNIITGIESPNLDIFESPINFFNKNFNNSQKLAVKKAIKTDSVVLIQGPPGTGKTSVILEIVKQIIRKNNLNRNLSPKKILLVSQSHIAIDKILLDLMEDDYTKEHLLRLSSNENKIELKVREHCSLQSKKDQVIKYTKENCIKNFNKLCEEHNLNPKELNKYFNELEKIETKETFNINYEFLNLMNLKLKNLNNSKIIDVLRIQKKWIDQIFKIEELEEYIIELSAITAGTCVGFKSSKLNNKLTFDYLIVDEAAKSNFPELAVAMIKSNKIILVGDHKQLSPIVTEDIAELASKYNLDLDYGLFERIFDKFPDEAKQTLNYQYRMHSTIGNLISSVFYDNLIYNGSNDSEKIISLEQYKDISIEWLSTSNYPHNIRHEKKIKNIGKNTYINNLEIDIIKNKLFWFDSNLNEKIEIGIITAYSAQKKALINSLSNVCFKNINIVIDTVDAFQGNEKDIIIYSTVRSNHKKNIGFLSKEERLNVAFSRAKSLLIIVGDLNFFNNKKISNNLFPNIIEYIKNNKRCRILYDENY
ncbi:AAA domain-containing protein [Clostridium perfringens]|uniref:AAA domain-containing protein n=1 Tax=Clostridium perfringens TaxID=1502 RepID=UPI0024BC6CB9|nr:AAA domain-containing protein [Clostridium perfringens]